MPRHDHAIAEMRRPRLSVTSHLRIGRGLVARAAAVASDGGDAFMGCVVGIGMDVKRATDTTGDSGVQTIIVASVVKGKLVHHNRQRTTSGNHVPGRCHPPSPADAPAPNGCSWE